MFWCVFFSFQFHFSHTSRGKKGFHLWILGLILHHSECNKTPQSYLPSSRYFHSYFVIRIFLSAFYHPHFSIRILSSAFSYPPSAMRHHPVCTLQRPKRLLGNHAVISRGKFGHQNMRKRSGVDVMFIKTYGSHWLEKKLVAKQDFNNPMDTHWESSKGWWNG